MTHKAEIEEAKILLRRYVVPDSLQTMIRQACEDRAHLLKECTKYKYALG